MPRKDQNSKGKWWCWGSMKLRYDKRMNKDVRKGHNRMITRKANNTEDDSVRGAGSLCVSMRGEALTQGRE